MDRSRSLEDIEGARWPAPPPDTSRLVLTAHALRQKPLAALTVEDLRLLVGQDIGLVHLLPLAVEVLRSNPLAEGDLYEGDLLAAVLSRAPAAWAEIPDAAQELAAVIDVAPDLPGPLRPHADRFLAAVVRHP